MSKKQKSLSSVSSSPLVEPLLLDIPEVAHVLSITVWTVRALVAPSDLRLFVQRKEVL